MEKELKELARHILEQQKKLQSLEGAFFLKRLFSIPSTRKRVRLMREIFEEKLRKWLEETNGEFRSLAQENLSLLAQDKVVYKTKSHTYSPVGTYSAYFTGKIQPDGYAHLELKKTNIGVYPLAKHDYVGKYLGHIDYFGNIELKPVKIESALVFTRPRSYEGYVNDKGVIVLNVVKRDLEVLTGHVVISGMIGLHFSDEDRREKFFSNRRRLMEIYNQARDRFLHQK